MAERSNQQKLDDVQYILTSDEGKKTLGQAYGWFILHETPVPGWNGGVSLAARIAGTDQAVNDIRAQLGSFNGQIAGLIGALAAVNKGEAFDEAKLLAGVQAAAEAGVKDAIESITVTIKEG
jgi:hypothetical protein